MPGSSDAKGVFGMTSGEKISISVTDVVENLAKASPGLPDPEAFVRAYLSQASESELDGVTPPRLAGLLAAHVALGRTRAPGADLIDGFTPRESTHGFTAGGSTLIQAVTDDRPFLVDTATMILADADWSLRNLHHPILAVSRDADGVLTDVRARGGAASTPESWMSIEAFPPLGQAGDELLPGLLDRLRGGLAAARVVDDDTDAIRQRVADAIRLLDETAQPVSPQEVRRVTELLRWLADDHFEFFGYREYKVKAGRFTPLPDTGLGILRGDVHDPFHALAPGEDDADVLVITKDSRPSPLHRPGHLDYVAVRTFDRHGHIVGERRFLGLLSTSAYAESVLRIPLLADKARRIAQDSGFDPDSHSGHMVADVIATFPRDELFQSPVEHLSELIVTVAGLQERRETRLFLRRGRYGRFWSCLVYLPRDRYRTAARERIQAILLERLGGESLDFRAAVTESVLARLLFVVKRPDDAPEPQIDPAALEREIVDATRMWDDDFNDAADELPPEQRGVDFGEAYKAAYTPRQGLSDLDLANQLSDAGDLRFAIYRPETPDDEADLRFKVITPQPMSLTRVMPHLSALGVDVTDERPFEWDLRGDIVRLFDFGFRLPAGQTLADWGLDDRQRFAEAFSASWSGRCHAGPLNRLVMRAGLTWQQVTWLRGMSRYLQQAGIPYSQMYVADALNANPDIAGAIVSAFASRFDPGVEGSEQHRAEGFETELAEILQALDAVESLDQDRILRMFVAVLRAIVRTNAFAEDRPALAFKLLPTELDLLPEPRPAYEIFVYSPRVQGVHLRFGAVARGGLRWSDRKEDFRTEILGLVKAQMVKNTVIVPVGAKGGFVPANLPDPRADRAGWLAEGVACYEIFISSLLSLTDNLVDGAVVPPPDVLRYDGDDTYLVVAADKGTATFSDIANRIAVERGFWLGDAFASGGSAGYDHKAMGITARGAWESVKRHFYELGIDCQSEDFTCVGIGDMAGDVFGNGMLLSEHTRLVAAFNHQHVFIDPDPDAAASFAERSRLFALPRSTWADYDASTISAGGGVWPRTAKSVPVSPQARAALGLREGVHALTPTELIRAILGAPVDLLWNGGIGTYVKGSSETHAKVGDKANDAVRLNGAQVRARVAGEGGNLGWTQAGRIEFAAHGGRVNTDFIDNSAGVDTSDHEVNIKILLAPDVRAGRLASEARNELLASMTDDVAQLVLTHNVDQNLALSTEAAQESTMASAQEEWMRALEADGLLDRGLESLPSREEMERRVGTGEALTRPELCSLLAWTKIRLESLVLDSPLPDDQYLADRLVMYFPRALRSTYAEAMQHHPLKREIVTMVTVNRFVNSQGITAFNRLAVETSSDVTAIVRAQLAARTIFAVAKHELALPGLGLPAGTEVRIRVALQQMIERATRWLLHNRRAGFDIRGEAAALTEPVAAVRDSFGALATESQRGRVRDEFEHLRAAGVPEEMARTAAQARYAHLALAVVDLSRRLERPLGLVEGVYFGLASELRLDRVLDRVTELPRTSRWDTMARAALRDDLGSLHADLVRAALEAAPAASEASEVLATWRGVTGDVDKEAAELAEITGEESSLARMSVALRTIRSLLV